MYQKANEGPSCQNCGKSYEDTEHFFLSCPNYAIQRKIMLHTVHNFIISVSAEILLHCSNQFNFTC